MKTSTITMRAILCALLASAGTAYGNFSDLWWDPAKPGRAISIEDQGSAQFALIFDYAPDGRATWLVAPAVGWNFGLQGDVYRAWGRPIGAPVTSTDVFMLERVGEIFIDFRVENTLEQAWYSVDGRTVNQVMKRFVFGKPPTCDFDDLLPVVSFQGLWWNSSEPGWAIHISEQATQDGSTIFALLATYAQDGQAAWLVASDLKQGVDGSYSGRLHRTRAATPGPLSQAQFEIEEVGNMRLAFQTGAVGELTYTADGASVSRPIERYRFGRDPGFCRR